MAKVSKNYVLDLCQLQHLTIGGHKVKTPYASSGTLEVKYKSLYKSHIFHQIN